LNVATARKKKALPPKYQVWVDARKRFGLSHRHIQMARELGLNPRKLGRLDNHDQESWTVRLPEFIENIYHRSFGREGSEVEMSIEEIPRRKKARKERARAEETGPAPTEERNDDPF
jgi:hypothetical protein